MKKIFSFLLLMATVVAMPVVLTSCGDDEVETIDSQNPEPEPEPEPEEDKFENLYGYWVNSDNSGAMEILEYSSAQCKIQYYVYTPKGLKTIESKYSGGNDSFDTLSPDGVYSVTVQVLSSSYNKLVLEDAIGEHSHLSSYIFSRVDESKFYEYLEGKNSGNSGDDDEPEDYAKKLIGTWVGYFMGPEEKYTLTFYSFGKATETCTMNYNGLESITMSGTYKYSNGKITEWNMDGSILMNIMGPCPWIVTFITPTEITIGDDTGFSMTFTKQ